MHAPSPPSAPGDPGDRGADREERFRELADAMPQLVWAARADGVVDYYNARAAQYDGIRQLDDGTWTWQPVLHDDDVEPTIRAWRRAVETGEPYEVEHRVRMRDGAFRWHISRGVPVPSGDGTVRWYGTATDIDEMRRAREQARANEARLQQALLVADIGIFERDYEAGTLYWSPTLRRLMGIEPDEDVTVERAYELAHPDDIAAVREAVARTHDPTGDGLYEGEYRIVRPDGGIRWVSVHARTLFVTDGGVRRSVRTVGAIADVTARHVAEDRIRESEERLRISADVAAIGTYDIDILTGTTFWSPPMRRILGLGEDATPHSVDSLVHPADLPAVQQVYLRAISPDGDGDFRVEHRVVRPDGTVRWVVNQARIYFEPVGGERRATRMIGALLDATERRQREELREAFIGMLSHELRTPVTSIYGGAQVLRRPGLDPDLREEILDGVVQESGRLVRLMENLLVIAKVERDVELGAREPILLRPIVRRVVHDARREHPDIPIDILEARPTPTVEGDEAAVELVLRNLVANAVKYGGLGPITVALDEDDGSVLVRVLDRGHGLGAVDPALLFDLFYRDARAQRRAAGSGIGLYVVRALVTAMRGRVWAQDRPDGGAEFGFALPRLEGIDADLLDDGDA